MYLVLEQTPNNLSKLFDTKIIKHIKGRQSALDLLIKTAFEYVETVGGTKSVSKTVIHDIDLIDQIKVPEADGYYIYRLTNDPDRLFIYFKETKINRGWVMNSTEAVWSNLVSFQIVQYEGLDIVPGRNDNIEFVPFKSQKNVPKQITISPFIDMISELKNSEKFKSLRV